MNGVLLTAMIVIATVLLTILGGALVDLLFAFPRRTRKDIPPDPSLDDLCAFRKSSNVPMCLAYYSSSSEPDELKQEYKPIKIDDKDDDKLKEIECDVIRKLFN